MFIRPLAPDCWSPSTKPCSPECWSGRGLKVERQKPIVFVFEDVRFEESFRADLLVENRVLVELKCVEKLAPVHGKQVLTYLRLLDLTIGLLINFGAARLQEGLHRILNARSSATPPD